MGEVIVALDLDTRAEAETLIGRLGDRAGFFKIGYQLFYGGDGLALGKELLGAGKKVFFDLKLLDIDNTVEKGVAAIAATGATMLTVHAYPQCMRAAVRGAARASYRPSRTPRWTVASSSAPSSEPKRRSVISPVASISIVFRVVFRVVFGAGSTVVFMGLSSLGSDVTPQAWDSA